MLTDLIEKGTSPYHAAEFCRNALAARGDSPTAVYGNSSAACGDSSTAARENSPSSAGGAPVFQPLSMRSTWDLTCGQNYLLDTGSSLIAFRLPESRKEMLPHEGSGPCVRITACHTDYPGFRIKSSPDLKDGFYGKIDTEVYGGPLDATWLDRPLGAAGAIALDTGSPFAPDIVLWDSGRPLFTIPSLAIHMDRDANRGREFNRQTQLIPLFTADAGGGDFRNYLASQLEVPAEKILSWDLTVYNADRPEFIGPDRDLLSAPRIDNLSSAAACLEGIRHEGTASGLEIAAFFNHEEIGSRTSAGADSSLLPDVIARIYESLAIPEADRLRAIYDGFLLSVDVAHALHPNYPEKADPANRPVMNHGFAVKQAFAQSYATQPDAIASVLSLCRRGNIPCQSYFNRSDIRGGHTLGVFIDSLLPMRAADIGLPILAMHSARELCGRKDYAAMTRLIRIFYEER